jgi:hypothetical protein
LGWVVPRYITNKQNILLVTVAVDYRNYRLGNGVQLGGNMAQINER